MAITLKSLSSRIDQLESRVNCHLQIDTIAADIDAAELPEDGDVCGRSVRQALRGIACGGHTSFVLEMGDIHASLRK
jgi:hypothetical protein